MPSPEFPVQIVDGPELPEREHPPICFVFHTTGTSDEAAIDRWYRRSKIGPHAMINRQGLIREYVSSDLVANHCGYMKSTKKIYEGGNWRRYVESGDDYKEIGADYSGYAMWDSRWSPRKSPLELVNGKSPNGLSIGIELQAPSPFTDAQYGALIQYVREKAQKYQIVLRREVLLGHYDVHPLARCNSKGDKDPGNFDWDRVINVLALDRKQEQTP